MRLLLIQLLDYRFPFGGAHKANRLLMEAMAARGHVCQVIAPGYEAAKPRADERERLLADLSTAEISVIERSDDFIVYRLNGVLVHAIVSEFALTNYAHFYNYLALQIGSLEPDWVLVSEDHTGLFLGAALELAPGRVVYVAHAQPTLPFGPEAFDQDPAKARLFSQVAGILTVSGYVQTYIRRWGGFDSTVVSFPVYGEPPFPYVADFTRGAVALVNASELKGLSIFMALAAAFPTVPFSAVASWGTGRTEREALEALPNVTLQEPQPNIDEILAGVRILLMPSLWGEAFGVIAVEAMLRGIPVLASDLGGIPEAKLGIAYLLPVTPISQYQRSSPFERPQPIVPPQDSGPWCEALARLLSDRAHYEQLSADSRAAALAFVESLGAQTFEAYLAELSHSQQMPTGMGKSQTGEAPAAPSAKSGRTRETDVLDERLAQLSPENRALLAARLAKKREAGQRIPRLPRSGEDLFPLSFAQERFWFLEQLNDGDEPGGETYTVSVAAYHLRGAFRQDLLNRSLDDLAKRHEIFRTSFPEVDGIARQKVWREGKIPLAVESLRHLDAAVQPEAIQERLDAEYRRGFRLAEGPLLRTLLLELADDERVLAFTLHHLIYDGWSINILLAELTELYRGHLAGRPTILPELPIQYGDFAAWQRQWLEGVRLGPLLAYWRQRLAGVPTGLDLPVDRLRPRHQTFRGSHLSFGLGDGLAARMRALGQTDNVSLSMLLLTAFKVLLYRYTLESDLVVGVPTAGRERTETEKLIGVFINLLAIRTQVAGRQSFRDLLPLTRRALLEGSEHQALPFEKLVAELAPERDLSRHPLFQVIFAFNQISRNNCEFEGAVTSWWETDRRQARVDLALETFEDASSRITLSLEFSTDLFDPATIERMARQLEALLTTLAERPNDPIAHLPLLTPEERRQLLPETTPPNWRLAEEGVHHLFALQVERQPEAWAIITPKERISFAALDRLADRVGTRLLEVTPRAGESRGMGAVALLLPNGIHHVAAMIGVLKAGRSFVCLDPAYPVPRLRQIVEDLRPSALLTNAVIRETHADLLHAWTTTEQGLAVAEMETIAARPWQALAVDPGAPQAAVYCCYTSGSTGRPKGIVQTHGGFRYLIEWFGAHFRLAPDQRIAQWIAVGHDPCYVEVWSSLVSGATLVIAPAEIRQDPGLLHGWIADSGVAVIQMTPSLCQLILDREIARPALSGLPALEAVLLTGEALPVALARRWLNHFGPRPALHNVYGPTESILVTSQHVERTEERQAAIPVGSPVPGCRIFVIDVNGEACPIGVPGELYLRSPFLARGYHGMSDETEAAFLQNPLQSHYTDRVYRTGDRGHWRADGTLELRGRLDRQVKLRGQRLELGEVEAALARHPAVEECAVQLYLFADDDPRLVAYIVVRGDLTAGALREWLRGEMPLFMVPGLFVFLLALPRTATGKVDYGALPGVDSAAPEAGEEFEVPVSSEEQVVAALFAEYLGRAPIGRRDHFFDSGGHSLLATRVANRLRDHYLIDVHVRDIFNHPTVAGLAGFLSEQLSRDEQVDFVTQLQELLETVQNVSEEDAGKLLSDLLS